MDALKRMKRKSVQDIGTCISENNVHGRYKYPDIRWLIDWINSLSLAKGFEEDVIS